MLKALLYVVLFVLYDYSGTFIGFIYNYNFGWRDQSTKYTHAERFDNEQYAFLYKVQNSSIDKHACICYACSKQVKRNINNPKFEPRWQSKPKVKAKCSIQECENTVLRHQTGVRLTTSFIHCGGRSNYRSLCQAHYNQLYTQLSLSAPCESGGGKPKKGERFNRHCPASDSVNTYLSIVSGNPCCLNEQSRICPACYNHFNLITTHIQKGTLSLTRESERQRNSDLDKTITLLSSKMSAIYRTQSVCHYVWFPRVHWVFGSKKVGECIKVDEAILLPTLHKELAIEAFTNAHHFPQVGGNLSEEDIPSCRWLLSWLYLYFEDKLEVHCRHKRYGTLLFHRSCDLIQALSTALGKNETIQRQADKLLACDTQTS